MDPSAVSFEVFGGTPSSPAGPERLPVVVYDAAERSELRPGPLLPDLARRIEIARRDNPDVAARLTDYAFVRACAEVMRALITGYTLWQHPEADEAPDGIENVVHVEFRPLDGQPAAAPRPAPHALTRHGLVYSPHLANPPSGALCWTSSTVAASDGELLSVYAFLSAPPLPDPARARDFPIITCQEADALFQATADAARPRRWRVGPDGARVYDGVGLRHAVRIDPLPARALERLTEGLDADGCLALMYVTRLLMTVAPLPADRAAVCWVDLDDIAARVWPAPRSREERRQQRDRIWRLLQFGERARLTGRRTGRYVDRATGEEIDTWMDGPVWRILDTERGLTAGDADAPPLRAQVAAAPAWTRATGHPNLAQYLPFGEALGAIPGNHASGAWARTVGLALAGFWRRHPRESLDGSFRPSRRELLTRYTPRTAPPLDVLSGNDPSRAVGYWRGALQLLAEAGFVAPSGEAALGLADMRRGLPRYEWQQGWLAAPAELAPGPRMADALAAIATGRRVARK